MDLNEYFATQKIDLDIFYKELYKWYKTIFIVI